MSEDTNIYKDKHLKEIEQAKIALQKDETNRKLLYSQAENTMMLNDIRLKSINIFIALVRKYEIDTGDIKLLLEVSQHLM